MTPKRVAGFRPVRGQDLKGARLDRRCRRHVIHGVYVALLIGMVAWVMGGGQVITAQDAGESPQQVMRLQSGPCSAEDPLPEASAEAARTQVVPAPPFRAALFSMETDGTIAGLVAEPASLALALIDGELAVVVACGDVMEGAGADRLIVSLLSPISGDLVGVAEVTEGVPGHLTIQAYLMLAESEGGDIPVDFTDQPEPGDDDDEQPGGVYPSGTMRSAGGRSMTGEDQAVPTERWSRLSERQWLSWEYLANSRFGEIFGIDLRSLAVLRVALALIVLADLSGRMTNLRVHYSDAGVLPRETVMSTLSTWRWSVSFLNGTADFHRALFIVTAVAAVGLLLGYRTRLMIVILWIMLLSFQIRNPLVLSAADLLLRMLLFWCMFLPLGAVWSIDAWRQRIAGPISMRFLSVGSAAFLLQIAFMYWFTAALKSGTEWRDEGSALYYALGSRHLTTPFGEWAHQFDTVLKGLTFATLGIEVVAPILLFSPILFLQARLLAIASLVGLHLGIWLTMDIGIFPWTSIFCMLAFVPSESWDWLARTSRAWGRSVNAWSRNQLGRVHATLDPEAPLGGAIHGVQQGWLRMTGGVLAVEMAQGSPTTTATVTGTTDPSAPAAPPRRTLTSSWLANVTAACCLVLIFGWNMSTVSAFTMPGWSHAPVYTLGLEQRWNMFAPRPPKATVWYAMVGTLRNGLQVEMLVPVVENDMRLVEPFTWEQPDNIASDHYHDKYWRKYFDAIANESSVGARSAFASYVCRSWNEYHTGSMQVVSLSYVIVADRTEPPGEPAINEQGRSVLGSFTCT